MNKTFILLLLCAVFFSVNTQAQLGNLKNKIKQKVDQRIEQKTNEAIDKSLDGAENSIEGSNGSSKGKGTSTNTKNNTTVKEENEAATDNNAAPAELKAYSKYDFVPGEKVVAFENFERAEIGDFPERWNTNATAEIVTLNSKEGKWLKLNKEGVWFPEFINNLPENFTLEFQVGVNNDFASPHLILNLASLENPEKDFTSYYHYVRWQGKSAIHLQIIPQTKYRGAWSRIVAGKDGNHTINNETEFKGWDSKQTNFAHIALWRQKNRLRVYVNGNKIWDLPRAFDAATKYNAITFAAADIQDQDYYVLGNIRLAIGAADTRNKLITEGKFVTTGITFDVNSDQIKPESYGTLKELATVLSENPEVKVKITGHTDSDGDDAKNLDLSKRRAASVKAALSKEFNIDGSRMETTGLGETKPVGDNKTAEGKAQNRRVEFVKQ